MMKIDNYKEIRQTAQLEANKAALANPEYAAIGGCDFGIWENAFGFTYMRLPLPKNRFGKELSCEVVSPALPINSTTSGSK